jgi:cyclase
MIPPRIIPTLLLDSGKLVKTTRFKSPRYIGDPINAVRIFNEKEVDELIVIDISASLQKREPPLKLIGELASECFMPLCYGGGIHTLGQARAIIDSGVEKICFQSGAFQNLNLIEECAKNFGSQAIVISIDVNRGLFGGLKLHSATGLHPKYSPAEFAQTAVNAGAGEILLCAVHREGTFEGYDLPLIREISSCVSVPVIALGGARDYQNLLDAIEAGASAAAAGSLFVYHGRHKAVLINVPKSAVNA